MPEKMNGNVEELLPCQFCKKRTIINIGFNDVLKYYYVRCTVCDSSGGRYKDRLSAIMSWNRKNQTEGQRVLEANQVILDGIERLARRREVEDKLKVEENDSLLKLKGLGKELWKDQDAQEYVDELRGHNSGLSCDNDELQDFIELVRRISKTPVGDQELSVLICSKFCTISPPDVSEEEVIKVIESTYDYIDWVLSHNDTKIIAYAICLWLKGRRIKNEIPIT